MITQLQTSRRFIGIGSSIGDRAQLIYGRCLRLRASFGLCGIHRNHSSLAAGHNINNQMRRTEIMASLRRRPGHRVPRSPRIITAEKIIETQNNNCLTQTHFLCKIWTEFNHCNKGSMVKTLRALIFILDISIFTQQPVM